MMLQSIELNATITCRNWPFFGAMTIGDEDRILKIAAPSSL
jgi:hypothetical protein